MLLEDLSVDRRAFEERTGWELKPQGACKGEVCIPLPDGFSDPLDIRSLAEQMGLPLVGDQEHGLWALGPESVGDRTLVSAEAPDLRLPDVDGNEFALSSLRGQKVVIVSWAPY
jgi:hypothetical protein